MRSRRAVLLLGGATMVTSVAALSALTQPSPTRRGPVHGPFSLRDFNAARADLELPDGVEIIPWDTVAGADDLLGDVLDRLTTRQLLGLPERDQPYLLDARAGFYANGVSEVQLADGSRQKVTSKAERWFSLARAPRGVVGLGPGAVIATTPTTWRSPAQPRPTSAGAVGRFYYGLDGARQKELVGAAETLIETETADSYFGNFTLSGPGDLGGIAYNGLALKKGGTAERIAGSGSWRGFAGIPNGETGLVTVKGGPYLVTAMLIDGRDPETGVRVGPSPIMINSSTGGTIQDVVAQCCVQGMPTNWDAQPGSTHVLIDFHSRWNAAHCVNLEKVGDGVRFRWLSGSLWRGNNPDHPSPDGVVTYAAHVGIDPRGSVTLTIGDDVDIDERTLTVESYGPPEYAEARKATRITVPGHIKLGVST